MFVSTSVRGECLCLGPVLGGSFSSWPKCFSACELNICPNQHIILEKPTTQQLKIDLQLVSSGDFKLLTVAQITKFPFISLSFLKQLISDLQNL